MFGYVNGFLPFARTLFITKHVQCGFNLREAAMSDGDTSETKATEQIPATAERRDMTVRRDGALIAGAGAVAALPLGAVAVGALAIGRLAISVTLPSGRCHEFLGPGLHARYGACCKLVSALIQPIPIVAADVLEDDLAAILFRTLSAQAIDLLTQGGNAGVVPLPTTGQPSNDVLAIGDDIHCGLQGRTLDRLTRGSVVTLGGKPYPGCPRDALILLLAVAAASAAGFLWIEYTI